MSLDFILDAVSADHDINASIKLLKPDVSFDLIFHPVANVFAEEVRGG